MNFRRDIINSKLKTGDFMSDSHKVLDKETGDKDSSLLCKKVIKKWVKSPIDKYVVNSIRDNLKFTFKFIDNTFIEGRIKWFNKYNLAVTDDDGKEYVLLKHALKYMKSSVPPSSK